MGVACMMRLGLCASSVCSTMEEVMASVPGPDPNKPLPRPGAPGLEPPHEDEGWEAAPDDAPSWLPEPYSPEREVQEEDVPLGVP